MLARHRASTLPLGLSSLPNLHARFELVTSGGPGALSLRSTASGFARHRFNAKRVTC
jgi:hypothetical protein